MEQQQTPPRTDLISAVFWMLFGGAIVIGAWRMDRLEYMHINPYTAPGLVPGILGAFIALFGLIMGIRAVRAGALAGGAAVSGGEPIFNSRVALSAALCIAFAAGLVGRGPPFWLAAGIFVFLHVFLFEYPERRARNEVAKGVLVALTMAVGASFVITMIFQELFLVRLP
jgi:Tripartite tricarboxylate transporter TctB family